MTAICVFFQLKMLITIFEIIPCKGSAGAALDLQGNHSKDLVKKCTRL